MSLRIAYLTNARMPARAANNVQVMKMCDAFVAAGHSVELFARHQAGGDARALRDFGVAPRFRVTAFRDAGPRGLNTIAWLSSLRRSLASREPDLFYSRDLVSLASVASFGRPMIYEAHWSPRGSLLRRTILRWLAASPLLRAVVTISSALAEEIMDLVPALGRERLVVAPSAADDVSGVVPVPLEGRAGVARIGYTGHLYPGKGVETIADVAARVPEADFHVVGGNEEELRRWRVVAPTNVIFHGHRPHRQIPGLLAGFDIVVAPYGTSVTVSGGTDVVRWMSPLKVIEYMAAGRAIVASDLPVLREILCHGDTAWLVPPRDGQAWADAVRNLVRDRAAAARLGLRARSFFRSHLTWPARARAVLAPVEDLAP